MTQYKVTWNDKRSDLSQRQTFCETFERALLVAQYYHYFKQAYGVRIDDIPLNEQQAKYNKRTFGEGGSYNDDYLSPWKEISTAERGTSQPLLGLHRPSGQRFMMRWAMRMFYHVSSPIGCWREVSSDEQLGHEVNPTHWTELPAPLPKDVVKTGEAIRHWRKVDDKTPRDRPIIGYHEPGGDQWYIHWSPENFKWKIILPTSNATMFFDPTHWAEIDQPYLPPKEVNKRKIEAWALVDSAGNTLEFTSAKWVAGGWVNNLRNGHEVVVLRESSP